ncbi:DUF6320 domain-containing protein [Cellulosilyticum ruminicola]|uniref:DUF6320 domain-containing protein n=1 Tax=Cellulosilyticum ruminicola TaxID=425254 RepID=UPI0006D0BE25|nr:DUF6320 domain-containing protein [Cellulosilyticum ruminicola]
MKICPKCQVEVLDDTCVCPLCLRVLQGKGGGTRIYPKVQFNAKRYQLVKRMLCFMLLMIVTLFSVINYLIYNSLMGYIIVSASAIYFAITVNYSVLHRANLAAKILVQTIGAQVLIFVIDYAIGYEGWSINYALPCICLIANLAIMLLMIINHMNCQEYIMYQLSMIILSLGQIILIVLKVIERPTLAIISVAISILILLGTILFGDKRVKNELIRRFHTQ